MAIWMKLFPGEERVTAPGNLHVIVDLPSPSRLIWNLRTHLSISSAYAHCPTLDAWTLPCFG
jgi:hypothetical protein